MTPSASGVPPKRQMAGPSPTAPSEQFRDDPAASCVSPHEWKPPRERRAPPLPAAASAPPGAAPLGTGAPRGDLPQPEGQLQPQEGVGCPANTPQPHFAPHFLIGPVGSGQTAGSRERWQLGSSWGPSWSPTNRTDVRVSRAAPGGGGRQAAGRKTSPGRHAGGPRPRAPCVSAQPPTQKATCQSLHIRAPWKRRGTRTGGGGQACGGQAGSSGNPRGALMRPVGHEPRCV